MKGRASLLAVLLSAGLLPPAAHAIPRDSRGPVPPACAAACRVEDWWISYDRGLRAIDVGDWNGAITALQEAVRQNSRSNFRARTYGMRFIVYLPYYYLGVAHYNSGDMEEALANFDRESELGQANRSPAHARQLAVLSSAAEALLEERARLATGPPTPPQPVAEPIPAARDPAKPEAPVGGKATTPAPQPTVPPPAPVPTPLPVPNPPVTRGDPPRIAIVAPTDLSRPVEGGVLRISGVAVDQVGIVDLVIEVNGSNAGRPEVPRPATSSQVTASQDPASSGPPNLGRIVNFAQSIPLTGSTNRVVIRVRNVNGQSSEETFEVATKR
jgi:hypothetical protein